MSVTCDRRCREPLVARASEVPLQETNMYFLRLLTELRHNFVDQPIELLQQSARHPLQSLFWLPTPALLAASGIVACTSRSQSRSDAYLFCVLLHEFSRKRETARSLSLEWLQAHVLIFGKILAMAGNRWQSSLLYSSLSSLNLLEYTYTARLLNGWAPLVNLPRELLCQSRQVQTGVKCRTNLEGRFPRAKQS